MQQTWALGLALLALQRGRGRRGATAARQGWDRALGATLGAADGIAFVDRARAGVEWALAPQPPRLALRAQVDALVNMAKDVQVLARAYLG